MAKMSLQKKDLPLYEIFINEGDDTGMELISLVDRPAIRTKGMLFNDEVKMQFKQVGDEQIIVGPAMIPNIDIYREDEEMGAYLVRFTEDTIKKLVEKFNRKGTNRRINIDHSKQMVDGFILEDWIIEDAMYDKSRMYGFELPTGTYMLKVKIEDKDFWENEVKGNEKFGFSIEGLLGQKMVKMEKDYSIDDLTAEDWLDILSSILEKK
jgi:hypothetical protein